MEAFARELRKAREAKRLTLADIYECTLIGTHLLEAMERGDFSILPQTYIRAFIREYAHVVGLDPEDMVRKYVEATAPQMANDAPAESARQQPSTQESAPAGLPATQARWIEAKAARFAFVGAVLVAGAFVVWQLSPGSDGQHVEEIPFQAVVKEHEALAGQSEPEPPPAAVSKPAAPRPDSLVLKVATRDSVWVEVFVDGQPPREYLFPPDVTLSWKAAEKFVLNIGNAGAIEFTLNAKKIGTVGSAGRVRRNVEFTRHTLKN